MAYAIMRCAKLKSMGSAASALKHCYRERETPNADPDRGIGNDHLAARSTDEAMGKLRELLPEHRRKDAVVAVEYVMTASPEWWKEATPAQQSQFFDRAQGWLAKKYGADRIITATIHRDETSPHLSAFVVPLTQDGRLSAKEFIGNRKQMSQDQTTFAGAVKDLGLERGIEGSRAKHQKVKAYYQALEQTPHHVSIKPEAVEPKVLRKRFFGLFTEYEAPATVAARLTNAVRKAYDPAVTAAAGTIQEREKARQFQETARDLRDRLSPVVDVMQPLGQEMRDKLMVAIREAGPKLLAEQTRQQAKAPMIEKGRYTGKIEDADAKHVYQAAGGGDLVKHAKEQLATVPQVGQTVTIQYQDGRGTLINRDIERRLERYRDKGGTGPKMGR